ncbi:MAG: CobW family GTP-binding protein [Succinivibrio sp.]
MSDNTEFSNEEKIPVNIITGFLGSGKTTLLNHWVNSEDFKDTLVLINEFGDVGLDHELVESVDSSVVLLQSGCICCSLQGALVDSLAVNYVKSQRGEIPKFKRVIIETTGLADPSGVITTLSGDDFLLEHYYHDGTITVLDAVNVREQIKKQYEAVKQVALADIIIVSKTDLTDSDEIDAIYEVAEKINPSAKLYPAVKGKISPKIILEVGPYKDHNLEYDSKVKSWLNIKKPAANLASSFRPATVTGEVGVAKRKIIAHSDIDSFALEYDEPIEALTLLAAISQVSQQYGDSILRIKGILDLKGQDKPVVIHGVLGNLYPLSELNSWPSGSKKSQLVFICRASVIEQIKHMLNEIMTNSDEATLSYYQQMLDNIEREDY